MRFNCVVVNTLIIFITFGAKLFAQEETHNKELREKAREYFKQGEVLFEAGDFDKAAEAFLLANKTLSHPTSLLNAALSYDRSENIPQAILTYEAYLTAVRDQDSEDPNVKRRVQRLRKKVGKIDVRAICQSDPCQIKVDGVDRGDAPVNVMVLPGPHHIEAIDEGKVIDAEYVVIGPGEAKAVHLEEKVEDLPVFVDMDRQKCRMVDGHRVGQQCEEAKLKAPFWVMLGLSGAVGLTGSSLWLSVLGDKEDFKAKDFYDPEEYAKAEQIKEKGENKQLVAGVLVGAAGCLAVAATVFAIRDLKSPDEDASDRVSFIFSVGPGIGMNVKF
ncbi:MAG: tetratricopeptide repeat protein [Myxococcota bacterium]|nr:tetratricopeptide repeat protein [Myxococcota bacterium]